MIELLELKEDKVQYHGDDEEIHRVHLHIKINTPTPQEIDAMQKLVVDFIANIGVKKE